MATPGAGALDNKLSGHEIGFPNSCSHTAVDLVQTLLTHAAWLIEQVRLPEPPEHVGFGNDDVSLSAHFVVDFTSSRVEAPVPGQTADNSLHTHVSLVRVLNRNEALIAYRSRPRLGISQTPTDDCSNF